MMQDRTHKLLAIACAAGLLTSGGAALVWPAHKERRVILDEIHSLEGRLRDLDGLTRDVEDLGRELNVMQRRIEDDLKLIPDEPNVAQIMRKLSLPVDGDSVIDQTFTAGGSADAVIGSDYAEQAVAVTVDMKATFDSTFALIHATERIDRLVRVSSVHLTANREPDDPAVPTLSASIGLEVIYEPPHEMEG
jgi:hypothetical protein